jgi:peroxiredoxin Q/BCP
MEIKLFSGTPVFHGCRPARFFYSLANCHQPSTMNFAMKPIRLLLIALTAMSFFANANAESLKVGDAAPLVSGITDTGATLNLGDVYKSNAYTVVWFYPKALTGGCTKQGCSLRDASSELTKFGAAVVGVSVDPIEKQKEFKATNNFPFPLIADTDKKVVKAFGQSALLMASRECYVIKDGKIVYKDTGVTDKQADNVLAFLNSQKKS